MERCHAFAKDTQSKSEPQSQLSKSAYSSVGHTQTTRVFGFLVNKGMSDGDPV